MYVHSHFEKPNNKMDAINTNAEISWTSTKYHIFELVAKFPMPIPVKLAEAQTDNDDNSSSSGGSGSGGVLQIDEIYIIKQLLRLQKVKAEVLLPSSPSLIDLEGKTTTRSAGVNTKVSIPVEYRGSFQVLPFETDMYRDISIEDILKYRPRYIKVTEKVTRITTGTFQLELNPGDELEMLGTTLRATKTGQKQYLRLRKNCRNFVLNPDCDGKFQIIKRETEYSLAEILERFPLPQKVALVKPEQHSDLLLKLLPTQTPADTTTLLLKSQSEEEYIIGRDSHERHGIIIDADDALLLFNIPDSLTPSSYDASIQRQKPQRSILMNPKRRPSGDDDLEGLHVEQVICRAREKLVVCKPIDQVFKSFVLPPRNKPTESTGSSVKGITETNTGPNAVYGNFSRTLSRPDEKLGRSVPVPPMAGDGNTEGYRVKLLTPDSKCEVPVDQPSTATICQTGEHEQSSQDIEAQHAQGEYDPDYDYPEVEFGEKGDDEGGDDEEDDYEVVRDDYEDMEIIGVVDVADDDAQSADNEEVGEIGDALRGERERTKVINYTNTTEFGTVSGDISPPALPPRSRGTASRAQRDIGTSLPHTDFSPSTHQDNTQAPHYDRPAPSPRARQKLPSLQTTMKAGNVNEEEGPPVAIRTHSRSLRSPRDIEPKYQGGDPSQSQLPSRLPSVPTTQREHKPPLRPRSVRNESSSNTTPDDKITHETLTPSKQRQSVTKQYWSPPAMSPPASSKKIVSDESGTTSPLGTSAPQYEPVHPPIAAGIDAQTEDVGSVKPNTTTLLRGFSVDQVVQELDKLNISKQVQEKFRDNLVDGDLLVALDEEILKEDFGLSGIHVLKIMKFVRGWRPNTGKSYNDIC